MARQYNNHGRDQINIEHIHIDSLTTEQELFHKGFQLLNQKVYTQASELLSKAIKTSPTTTEAHYYLAIALLNGTRPEKADGWTIKKIEELLNAAAYRNPNSLKYYMLWAIIKYGYYTMNGFIEKPPQSVQLFQKGKNIQLEDANEILWHFKDPKNQYWAYLNNKI